MVTLFVSLIQKGLWAVDQVPLTWRTDVEAVLTERTPE